MALTKKTELLVKEAVGLTCHSRIKDTQNGKKVRDAATRRAMKEKRIKK